MSRGRDASCQRLPHRALVSGNDAKAYQRIGMEIPGKRNPPGDQALHHVMIRGIEGKEIFRDTLDPKDFVTRTRILAWSLLGWVRVKIAWILSREYGIAMVEIVRQLGVCASAIN